MHLLTKGSKRFSETNSSDSRQRVPLNELNKMKLNLTYDGFEVLRGGVSTNIRLVVIPCVYRLDR